MTYPSPCSIVLLEFRTECMRCKRWIELCYNHCRRVRDLFRSQRDERSLAQCQFPAPRFPATNLPMFDRSMKQNKYNSVTVGTTKRSILLRNFLSALVDAPLTSTVLCDVSTLSTYSLESLLPMISGETELTAPMGDKKECRPALCRASERIYAFQPSDTA